jgi:hypothetical protein
VRFCRKYIFTQNLTRMNRGTLQRSFDRKLFHDFPQ